MASYDKNVRDNAFANVQEFYDRVSADDYKKSQLLVSNLDDDWSFFGMVPNCSSPTWSRLHRTSGRPSTRVSMSVWTAR